MDQIPTLHALDSTRELKRMRLDLEQISPKQISTQQDYLLENKFSDAKLFVGIFVGGVVGVTGVWASWNVKNILKIDIFPGGHHTSIDDINSAVGM